MKNSYFGQSLINFVITLLMVAFVWTTIFPASTIMENGDITFNVRWLLIDHVEIKGFITNTETLETELEYWIEPIDVHVRGTEITISNETMVLIEQKLFSDNGAESKITFEKVVAIPRLNAMYIVFGLYIALTLGLIPYLFKKKFS